MARAKKVENIATEAQNSEGGVETKEEIQVVEPVKSVETKEKIKEEIIESDAEKSDQDPSETLKKEDEEELDAKPIILDSILETKEETPTPSPSIPEEPSEENDITVVTKNEADRLARIFKIYPIIYIDSKSGVYDSPTEGTEKFVNPYFNK